MSFAEPETASNSSSYDKALYSVECEKWASDFAHAYYALVKGEADLGDLMDWGYELWPERMQESALHVAQAVI